MCFLNSPSNGGDWGAKEDLTGQPCGAPNSWNDRLMPSIASDTTVLHCFGSCANGWYLSCSSACSYLVITPIDMHDSVMVMDGTEHAVDVAVNGAVVVSGATIINGSTGLENFTASTGDAIALSNWVTGSYTGEVSWDITDGAGTIISSGVFGDLSGGAGLCPSCPPPSGITLANLGSTSVDISWTPGGTETEWYFEINGSGSSVTSTTQSVTGLAVNDTAYVYIASICRVGDTSNITSGSFNTLCNASLAPTNENFDLGFSVCWSQEAKIISIGQ